MTTFHQDFHNVSKITTDPSFELPSGTFATKVCFYDTHDNRIELNLYSKGPLTDWHFPHQQSQQSPN